jgi:hypothetical protein
MEVPALARQQVIDLLTQHLEEGGADHETAVAAATDITDQAVKEAEA